MTFPQAVMNIIGVIIFWEAGKWFYRMNLEESRKTGGKLARIHDYIVARFS